MDYRELAVDELKKLNHNYAKEKLIKSNILELEARLTSLGGSSRGIAENSGGNKTENKWVDLISQISDEKQKLCEVKRAINRVERALSVITDAEAGLLRKLYVKGLRIDETSENMHISTRTVCRLREHAIINFTRALYGSVVT